MTNTKAEDRLKERLSTFVLSYFHRDLSDSESPFGFVTMDSLKRLKELGVQTTMQEREGGLTAVINENAPFYLFVINSPHTTLSDETRVQLLDAYEGMELPLILGTLRKGKLNSKTLKAFELKQYQPASCGRV